MFILKRELFLYGRARVTHHEIKKHTLERKICRIKDFFFKAKLISNIVNLQNPIYIIALLGIAVIEKLIGKSVCFTGPQLILNSNCNEICNYLLQNPLKHFAATIYYTLLYKIIFCLLFATGIK